MMNIFIKGDASRYMKFGLYIFYLIVCVLFICAYIEYKGEGYIYILFTIVSNVLLYLGFRQNAIFFDAFIGVFFWLGFWLKLTVRVAFLDGLFNEPVGGFDGSGPAFDYSLLITSCGLLGLVVASYLRERLIFCYPRALCNESQGGLFHCYIKHRKLVLSGFVVLFLIVAVTNAYFGIYQKGEISRAILPYGLSGVYKWLLLFGMASFSALILHFEFLLNRSVSIFVVLLCLLETFFTSVSLLSRGMVLNASALGYGLIRNAGLRKFRLHLNVYVVSGLIFVMLFGGSVLVVNYLRSSSSPLKYVSALDIESIQQSDIEKIQQKVKVISNSSKVLFLDRWVGIEGVMAVAGYPKKGWDLWNTAWREVYVDSGTSYYDLNLITSSYKNMDMSKHHHISLPGILAFCFYPGSYAFLFGCMVLIGLIAGGVELSVYKLGGKNIILCSLLAQVVAYRYAHFGYVPGQSYLLFGALFLNLGLIYYADKALGLLYDHRKNGG